jgi:hypothetical protein
VADHRWAIVPAYMRRCPRKLGLTQNSRPWAVSKWAVSNENGPPLCDRRRGVGGGVDPPTSSDIRSSFFEAKSMQRAYALRGEVWFLDFPEPSKV